MTGGRLNVAAAMQGLGLLLQERGLPALPGALLSERAAADLRGLLMRNQWGQELLLGSAEAETGVEHVEASPAPPPSPAPSQHEAHAGWLPALPPLAGEPGQHHHTLEAEQQHVQLEAPAAAPMPLAEEWLDAARAQTAQVEAAALPVQPAQQQVEQPQAAAPLGADQQQGAGRQRRQRAAPAPT